MFGLAGVGLLLLAPASPVPAPPPAANATVDQNQAAQFAQLVYGTARRVAETYAGPSDDDNTGGDYETFIFHRLRRLFAGAIQAMYEEAGVPVPDPAIQAAYGATGTAELQHALIAARVRLGNVPALSGPRSLFIAINGFRHATDPYCGIVSHRLHTFVSVDMDFGVGLELDGMSGPRWTVYRVERGVAAGTLPATGMFGPVPKLEDVLAPVSFPWRIKRVIPGSPAQRAGVKPGDTITHVNGTEITAENANRQFAQLAFPAGQPTDQKWTFTLGRAGRTDSITLTLQRQGYTPETVLGVIRTPDGNWNCMLDHEYRIGYVRLGAIEESSDDRLGEMLDDLAKRGCRGLVLDLRWCPGGYVSPGTQIAGMFLRPNDLVAEVRASKVIQGPNDFGSSPSVYRAPPAPVGGKFRGVPVVILVGAETTGGGELIAAALQDNDDRADPKFAVMGQRTAGRAAIQVPIPAGFGGLEFKVTRGETLRPSGKTRQRKPTSRPTDDWGIRPDPGLEVPVTADLSAQLRQWADEHALRPADGTEALPFDDPQKDPYRAAALAYFRKKLGRPMATKD